MKLSNCSVSVAIGVARFLSNDGMIDTARAGIKIHLTKWSAPEFRSCVIVEVDVLGSRP